ncbi:hypothetical protein D5086_019871 [Populus alba]|uniref:Uncharacterized protein n=1 Tax=Populus alba TaxID=43335 RepID=A0ACC4BIG6_POPAL
MISRHKVGVEAARGRSYVGAARAAIIFLFWILLILAQLGVFLVVHEETDKLVKSLPRKARFFETGSLHASPNQDQPVNIDGGDPDAVYEDDKRIIHTVFSSAVLFCYNSLSLNLIVVTLIHLLGHTCPGICLESINQPPVGGPRLPPGWLQYPYTIPLLNVEGNLYSMPFGFCLVNCENLHAMAGEKGRYFLLL